MTTSQNIALIAVTQQGLDQARRLRQRLQTGALYRPARYGPAGHVWEHLYETALSAQVAALFAQYDQLIFFLATGAVTRLHAPCLDSKTTDPGVLAIDEAGRFVIPVLSGHTGGANALARTVASLATAGVLYVLFQRQCARRMMVPPKSSGQALDSPRDVG